MKGLAFAPPYTFWSIGVSNSRNSLSVRYRLISEMSLLLIMKISRFSVLTIRSRYLFLYLVSMFFKPWNFSGKAQRDFESRENSDTLMEFSPLFVLKSSP